MPELVPAHRWRALLIGTGERLSQFLHGCMEWAQAHGGGVATAIANRFLWVAPVMHSRQAGCTAACQPIPCSHEDKRRTTVEIFALVEGFGPRGGLTYRSAGYYATPGDLLTHLLCQQNNRKTAWARATVGEIVTRIDFSKRSGFRPYAGWRHAVQPLAFWAK